MVWEKLNIPLAAVTPKPVRGPLLKSAFVMPVPESSQKREVPVGRPVVCTVVFSTEPSFRARDDAISMKVAVGGNNTGVV